MALMQKVGFQEGMRNFSHKGLWGRYYSMPCSEITPSEPCITTKSCMRRFEGLEHLGPMQDPAHVAQRVATILTASVDAAAWAALPRSQTLGATTLAHSRL